MTKFDEYNKNIERASASGGYKETVLYPNIAGNQK